MVCRSTLNNPSPTRPNATNGMLCRQDQFGRSVAWDGRRLAVGCAEGSQPPNLTLVHLVDVSIDCDGNGVHDAEFLSAARSVSSPHARMAFAADAGAFSSRSWTKPRQSLDAGRRAGGSRSAPSIVIRRSVAGADVAVKRADESMRASTALTYVIKSPTRGVSRGNGEGGNCGAESSMGRGFAVIRIFHGRWPHDGLSRRKSRRVRELRRKSRQGS